MSIFRKNKEKKTEDQKTLQTTKVYVGIILGFSCAWITWSYVLATIGVFRSNTYTTVETLSSTVCKTVIATIITYCCKAWLETFCDKFNDLVMKGKAKFSKIRTDYTEIDDSDVDEDFMTVEEYSNKEEYSDESCVDEEDISESQNETEE